MLASLAGSLRRPCGKRTGRISSPGTAPATSSSRTAPRRLANQPLPSRVRRPRLLECYVAAPPLRATANRPCRRDGPMPRVRPRVQLLTAPPVLVRVKVARRLVALLRDVACASAQPTRRPCCAPLLATVFGCSSRTTLSAEPVTGKLPPRPRPDLAHPPTPLQPGVRSPALVGAAVPLVRSSGPPDLPDPSASTWTSTRDGLRRPRPFRVTACGRRCSAGARLPPSDRSRPHLVHRGGREPGSGFSPWMLRPASGWPPRGPFTSLPLADARSPGRRRRASRPPPPTSASRDRDIVRARGAVRRAIRDPRHFLVGATCCTPRPPPPAVPWSRLTRLAPAVRRGVPLEEDLVSRRNRPRSHSARGPLRVPVGCRDLSVHACT